MDPYALMVSVLRKHRIDPEVVLEQMAHRYLLAASANFTLAGRAWLDLGNDLLQTASAIRSGGSGEDGPSER